MTDALAHLVERARAPLYRNAYALVLNTAATSGLGVVYWMLAARLYSADAVGLNSALISTMMFLVGLSELNLSNAMTRFIPVAGRSTRRLVRNALGVSFGLSILAGGVYVLGINVLSPAQSFLADSPPVALAFMAATAVWCMFTQQDFILAGLRHATWVTVKNALFGAAKIVLMAVFAAEFAQFGIFASWTLPTVAVVILVNWLIFRRLIPRHEASPVREGLSISSGQVARYVAGDYAGALFALTVETLMPLVVIHQLTVEANAYFYLGWVIAYPLFQISVNMATSLTVEGASEPDKFGLYSRRILRHIMRLLLPAVAVGFIGAPFILGIFGPDYAAESTALLRLLCLAAIPYSLKALYISFCRVRRRMTNVVIVEAAACLSILGLSYALLPSMGIAGVGVAWLASQCMIAGGLLLTQLGRLRRWLQAGVHAS